LKQRGNHSVGLDCKAPLIIFPQAQRPLVASEQHGLATGLLGAIDIVEHIVAHIHRFVQFNVVLFAEKFSNLWKK